MNTPTHTDNEMRETKDAAFREWLPKQNGNVGQESYEPWSDGFETAWQAARTPHSISEGERVHLLWLQTCLQDYPGEKSGAVRCALDYIARQLLDGGK